MTGNFSVLATDIDPHLPCATVWLLINICQKCFRLASEGSFVLLPVFIGSVGVLILGSREPFNGGVEAYFSFEDRIFSEC